MTNIKNLYPGMIIDVINPYDNRRTLKAEVKKVYPRFAIVYVSCSSGGYSMAVDAQSIVDSPIISLSAENYV